MLYFDFFLDASFFINFYQDSLALGDFLYLSRLWKYKAPNFTWYQGQIGTQIFSTKKSKVYTEVNQSQAQKQ